MMHKAQNHLLSSTSQADFDRRLITSMTFACQPEKLEEAKMRIEAAMFEVAELLNAGDCTEIYQYNIQFFPLTRRKA